MLKKFFWVFIVFIISISNITNNKGPCTYFILGFNTFLAVWKRNFDYNVIHLNVSNFASKFLRSFRSSNKRISPKKISQARLRANSRRTQRWWPSYKKNLLSIWISSSKNAMHRLNGHQALLYHYQSKEISS